MFKWQHPIQEGLDLFYRTIVDPPIYRVEIVRPEARPDYDTSQLALQPIADKMLDVLRPRIQQWVTAQRMIAHLGNLPVHRAQTTYPGAAVAYTRMHGREQLDVRVYPKPPLLSGDELCALIFYGGNKIAAVPMVSLSADAWTAKYTATLKNSAWGDDLIKVSQYKFSKEIGTVAFTPFTVERNVISKKDVYYLAPMKLQFRAFLESQTLANRTPRLNGTADTVYAPNDIYTLVREGQTSRLVRDSTGGNGAFPYAISSDGKYYYGPVSYSTAGVNVSGDSVHLMCADPYEQFGNSKIWTANVTRGPTSTINFGNYQQTATDTLLTSFATENLAAFNYFDGRTTYADPFWSNQPMFAYVSPLVDQVNTLYQYYPGGPEALTTIHIGTVYDTRDGHVLGHLLLDSSLTEVAPPGTSFVDDGVSNLKYYDQYVDLGTGFRQFFGAPYSVLPRQQAVGPLYRYRADSGYGVYQGENYTMVRSTAIESRLAGVVATVRSSYSLDMPFSVFEQIDKLDVVSVAFVPVTASVHNDTIETGTIFGRDLVYNESFEFLSYRFERYDYDYADPSYDTVHTGSVGDNGTLYGPVNLWLISYPPSLGTTEGKYYFHAAGTFYTPYGHAPVSVPAYQWVNKELQMWRAYIPWMHLSNGEVFLQAYSMNGERRVFFTGKAPDRVQSEATSKIEKLIKDDIDTVQAILLDIPLGRIKELA